MHKFIFLKPTKVAGTSVEANLARQCGPDDIITPTIERERTTGNTISRDHRFYNHISPNAIRRLIPDETWRSYAKITIVRNPWDLCVSRYWWDRSQDKLPDRLSSLKNIRLIIDSARERHFISDVLKIMQLKFHPLWRKKDFTYFIEHLPSIYTNTRYYFEPNGNRVADYYLRFENLNKDYQNLCNNLSIPYESLPVLKSNVRTSKAHYSTYYTEKTKEIIQSIFAEEIERFGYSFEHR